MNRYVMSQQQIELFHISLLKKVIYLVMINFKEIKVSLSLNSAFYMLPLYTLFLIL